MRDWTLKAMAALAAIVATLATIVLPYEALARDRSVPQRFQQVHPCPSTGARKGACPGWERDHILPLCRGGADHPANMQWLSTEQHKAKTRGDIKDCRAFRLKKVREAKE